VVYILRVSECGSGLTKDDTAVLVRLRLWGVRVSPPSLKVGSVGGLDSAWDLELAETSSA
jgi:hypothetical protein